MVPVTASCDWVNSPTSSSLTPASSMKVIAQRPLTSALSVLAVSIEAVLRPERRQQRHVLIVAVQLAQLDLPSQSVAAGLGGEVVLVARHHDVEVRAVDLDLGDLETLGAVDQVGHGPRTFRLEAHAEGQLAARGLEHDPVQAEFHPGTGGRGRRPRAGSRWQPASSAVPSSPQINQPISVRIVVVLEEKLAVAPRLQGE